jgi:type III restriction enzyme
MSDLQLHPDAVAEIAARLDLREPNRVAVETIDARVSQHYDVEDGKQPFEAVLDSATGVGKTYILVGAMELFAATYGVSDFVIVTPGRTILEKTRDNFTPGHPKSLLGSMSFQPVVITAENFATPSMRAAMDDAGQVKVYLFTVQSLIKPESKVGRKTHKFQEGLGMEFYAHLQRIESLVVFADEHHAYYGPAFSQAVRNLDPWVLLGLTATPDKKTPLEQIIYRYPLAAAIADKYVKTPVIVGRRDDRIDALTKLSDGLTLLEAKAQAIAAYSQARAIAPMNPVMLVVAKNIEEANEFGAILMSTHFAGGGYADSVLVVHSNSPDVALEALSHVEDMDSPVRIIISVGMLKEGWDVKNVYVIASMRSSVSEILTEQTLGRGMRLPFGSYTGIEILDTLEVVAHERYEELLKKAGVLNKSFVDYRSWAALRVNAKGKQVVVTEAPVPGTTPLVIAESPGEYTAWDGTAAAPTLTPVEERTQQVATAVLRLKVAVARRTDISPINIPVLRMTAVRSAFSLADIVETDRFRKLGLALGTDPQAELNRTVLSAKVVIGPDGIKHTELVTAAAADKIESTGKLFPIEGLRWQLADMVLGSAAVPARKEERAALQPLLDAFFEGLGPRAESVLSANLTRAGARLITLVSEEQRRFMPKPTYDEVVELKRFDPVRVTDKPVSGDRLGAFSRSMAYEGWKRSLYALEWFDSTPERTVANIVDDDGAVTAWVRLHVGELPILWNGQGQEYNPDLLVIDADGTHWLVETKMDKEMETQAVQGKREAALRWTNHVNADHEVSNPWHYLLVSEADVKTAKGSWLALKKLGSY